MTWLARLKEKVSDALEDTEVAIVAKGPLATLATDPSSQFKNKKSGKWRYQIDADFKGLETCDPLNLRLDVRKVIQDIPLSEIRKLAGDDYTQIQNNPDAWNSFAYAVATRRMRESGKRPDYYTQKSICCHCGPVWLWEGAPAHVDGCPWCFNRVKGMFIPKPESE